MELQESTLAIVTYCNLLSDVFACEYAQKYIARDGATPTIFGPNPLNKAREPSVSTIYLNT